MVGTSPRRSHASYRILNRRKTDLDEEESNRVRFAVLDLDLACAPDAAEYPESPRTYVVENFENYTMAVLVSDTSGFSRVAKEHGVLHTASLIVRTRQICLPILIKHSAANISVEAENLIAVFPSAAYAVLAAQEMMRTVSAYNATLPPCRSHFALSLDGIGIDYGRGPIVDSTGKFLGRTFRIAYALGEEMCTNGGIVLSARAKEEVDTMPELGGVEIKSKDFGKDTQAAHAADLLGGVFQVVGQEALVADVSDVGEFVDVEDDSLIGSALQPLAQRHKDGLKDAELKALDSEIASENLKWKAVLVFDYEFHGVDGSHHELSMKFDMMCKLRALSRHHHGMEIEDVAHVFDDPVDAVLMATACQREFGGRGRGHSGAVLRGFGIHMGNLLLVPGTDIHWGEPMDIASKLGQDAAVDGLLFISMDVFEVARRDPRTASLHFKKATVVRSGTSMECRIVDIRSPSNEVKRTLLSRLADAGLVGANSMIDEAVMQRVLFSLDPKLEQGCVDQVLKAVEPKGGIVDLAAFLDAVLSSSSKKK